MNDLQILSKGKISIVCFPFSSREIELNKSDGPATDG